MAIVAISGSLQFVFSEFCVNMNDILPTTTEIKIARVVKRRLPMRRITKQGKHGGKLVVDAIVHYLRTESKSEIEETHFFFSSLVEKREWYDGLKEDKFCPRNSSRTEEEFVSGCHAVTRLSK